jgi:hypothetical protein
MYSFAQRPDIRVVDEPLYGHYLRVTGAAHPGREEVLAAMNCGGDAVMQELLQAQADDSESLIFAKHMAHHLIDIDLAVLQKTANVFLVRDPREMLPSLTVQLPHATLNDTGLEQQWKIFCELRDSGQKPVVLDSRELLLNPSRVLQQLCDHLNIEFDANMLSWPAGPRAEDGVWAPHWYHAVHISTGFSPYRKKHDFPKTLQALLNDCTPWYDKLYDHSLRARP